jgi:DNA invertase Pin-like site-specific DNA recombinase
MIETHLQSRGLGYARVSTYRQTLDAQLEQLRGAGCSKIYREKVSGARTATGASSPKCSPPSPPATW